MCLNSAYAQSKGRRSGFGRNEPAKPALLFSFVMFAYRKRKQHKQQETKATQAQAHDTHKNKGASVADEEGHLVHLPVAVVANLSLRNLPRDRAIAEARSTEQDEKKPESTRETRTDEKKP